MEIKKMLVPESRYSVLCPYPMNPTEITFHNTYNDATALNERNNVANNSTGTSFHIAVDDKEAIQLIPFNRNAWHAGDGNGPGNRNSIGIEICYSMSGGERYRKAELNAIQVICQLMDMFNIPISKVKTHQERNGKYCPHRMLDEGKVGWFKSQVAQNKTVEAKPMKWTMKTGGLGVDATQEIIAKLAEFKTKGNLVSQGDGNFYLQCEPVEDRNQLGAITWYVKDYKGWYAEVYQVQA